jgi:hypothetical protein
MSRGRTIGMVATIISFCQEGKKMRPFDAATDPSNSNMHNIRVNNDTIA